MHSARENIGTPPENNTSGQEVIQAFNDNMWIVSHQGQ